MLALSLARERIPSMFDHGIGGVPSASLWTGSAAAAEGRAWEVRAGVPGSDAE